MHLLALFHSIHVFFIDVKGFKWCWSIKYLMQEISKTEKGLICEQNNKWQLSLHTMNIYWLDHVYSHMCEDNYQLFHLHGFLIRNITFYT